MSKWAEENLSAGFILRALVMIGVFALAWIGKITGTEAVAFLGGTVLAIGTGRRVIDKIDKIGPGPTGRVALLLAIVLTAPGYGCMTATAAKDRIVSGAKHGAACMQECASECAVRCASEALQQCVVPATTD